MIKVMRRNLISIFLMINNNNNNNSNKVNLFRIKISMFIQVFHKMDNKKLKIFFHQKNNQ